MSTRRDYQEADRSAWAGLRGDEGIERRRGSAGAGADLGKSGRGEDGVVWGYHDDFVGFGMTVTPHFNEF